LSIIGYDKPTGRVFAGGTGAGEGEQPARTMNTNAPKQATARKDLSLQTRFFEGFGISISQKENVKKNDIYNNDTTPREIFHLHSF
jgi:hypothetical protein